MTQPSQLNKPVISTMFFTTEEVKYVLAKFCKHYDIVPDNFDEIGVVEKTGGFLIQWNATTQHTDLVKEVEAERQRGIELDNHREDTWREARNKGRM